MGVALRKESVDRNKLEVGDNYLEYVALRKESVDRNCGYCGSMISAEVALRKESVDRNTLILWECRTKGSRSPQGERG